MLYIQEETLYVRIYKLLSEEKNEVKRYDLYRRRKNLKKERISDRNLSRPKMYECDSPIVEKLTADNVIVAYEILFRYDL